MSADHFNNIHMNRIAALLAILSLSGDIARAQHEPHAGSDAAQLGRSVERAGNGVAHFNCGYRSPQSWVDEVRAAAARGEISDPATRMIPPILRSQPQARSAALPCLSPAHVFAFEDTDQLLLTDFSIGQLFDLMAVAANDLMAAHGDIYDFVGFWLNFAPHHVYGTAAYIAIENDVTGIGAHTLVGTELFNNRAELGVGGQHSVRVNFLYKQLHISWVS